MFCREQVARLSDRLSDIRGAGAELYAIGTGSVGFAEAFKEDFHVGFPLFTDDRRRSYQALGLKRDRLIMLRPETYKNAARALKQGHRQGMNRGDLWQLGGTLVIMPGDAVRFVHADQSAGDHAAPDDVIAALGRPS